jgi:hypothetical protein
MATFAGKFVPHIVCDVITVSTAPSTKGLTTTGKHCAVSEMFYTTRNCEMELTVCNCTHLTP